MQKSLPATQEERALREVRLLAEAGFIADARREAAALRARQPLDPERLGLEAQLAHRVGAISEALRLWRLLHDASPHAGAAVFRLAALRAEEGKVGPATGFHLDLPYVRKALRHVEEGRYDRALATCAEGGKVAAAAGDREQRKLLALLEALVHELGGRYAAAATVLEQLGRDASFAHDLDRLALLARVCERAGDRSGLISAERVLAFLAGSGKLSAFERLIHVRRVLGDEERVAEAERAYEAAFEERMQRLSPEQRLSALETRFLPPARFARLELPPLEQAASAPQRGILLLLRGRPEEARAELQDTPRAWRAAAALACGDAAEALRWTCEAIEERGEADGPLAWLLAEAVAAAPEHAIPEGALQHAREALHRAASIPRPDPRLLAHLARVEGRLGRREREEELRARIHAIEAEPWPHPGVVRAAAIYALPGKLKGVVHDVIARRRSCAPHEGGRLLDAEIHGHLAPGTRQQLRRTFAAVREWLLVTRPEKRAAIDAFAYGIHITKEDEPSAGPSMALPVGVAFASLMLGVPAPSDAVFTGALSYDSVGQIAVLPVGEIGVKLKGALHAGAGRLVLPATQREEALSGQFVPPSIASGAVAPVATFAEAWALVEAAGPAGDA